MNELLNMAITAYRSGQVMHAIEMLEQITQQEENNWLALFYLAMAYRRVHWPEGCRRTFEALASRCPDASVKQRARAALNLIDNHRRLQLLSGAAAERTQV
jgi:cytochrome c-type biogenesis protein CcmH/NrfG